MQPQRQQPSRAFQRAKSLFLTLHRWLGLTSGLILFVVASTGALYVFEEELRDAFQGHLLYVPAQESQQSEQANNLQANTVKASDVLAIMRQQFPQEKIEQIRFRSLPNKSTQAAAVLVFTKSRRVYSLNPYNGQVMGVRDMATDIMAIIVELHTELLAGRMGLKELGEQVVKWNVLVFFVMLVTGIVLWTPVHMRFLRDALRHSFRVRWRVAPLKRNYDMHRVAGFYALWVMLLVAWTGIFWVFDSVENSVYAAFGTKKLYDIKPSSTKPAATKPLLKSSARPDGAQILDHAHAEVLRYGVPALVNIQMPKKETDALRVLVRYPYRFVRKQSVFYFDQYTGTFLKSDLHENYTTPDKIRVSNFDLHTGRMFGLPSKILWFMAAIFTASLPVTGAMLWWQKRKQVQKQRGQRKRTQQTHHRHPAQTPSVLAETPLTETPTV